MVSFRTGTKLHKISTFRFPTQAQFVISKNDLLVSFHRHNNIEMREILQHPNINTIYRLLKDID